MGKIVEIRGLEYDNIIGYSAMGHDGSYLMNKNLFEKLMKFGHERDDSGHLLFTPPIKIEFLGVKRVGWSGTAVYHVTGLRSVIKKENLLGKLISIFPSNKK